MNRLSRGAKLALLFSSIVVVFLLFFAGGLIYRWMQKPSLTLPETSVQESSQGEEPAKGGGKLTVLAGGIDDTQQLTDVIMLVCLDFDEGSIEVLQIPRDTFVGWETPTGKINAIYGQSDSPDQGIKALESRVETLTGITVDYYAAITLNGLRNVVDYMGGVPINIPQVIEYLPGKTLWPGEQVLDGERAEWFVRYRAGYATGDIGRISAQQLFLEAAMDMVRDKGRIETLKAVSHNYDNIITDIPLLKTVDLAQQVWEIPNEKISFHMAPGDGVMAQGYAVYALDRDKLAQVLNEFFGEFGQAEPESLDIPQVEPS